ncbi:hypothetical protein ABFS82_14G206100 [Erythranthe guttata]|uniref:CRIB domain-containing protein n=1 Tax=Erythranthe guttata TaxID=4155 RepID=A0A022PNV3_ERYGU|nr:PREDICTED: CRIB domain-containing protein RIC6 [Erythranthe guttata]EYU17932.1 hypothetical protein MIMGU_mgv1a013818mg [Erythranthe guttata]|eukprot:XP_012828892.1 PREDICTED: CRIB domain-containing protein RIC6 [Erythranthe guttata]
MTNKMKGLLKGLRYISQIFDEEKEQEMQIGLPTDVKHVAHIGWDGPAADSPGWMNDINSSSGLHSAPLGPHGDPKDNSQIKWVSEDSKRSSSQKATSNNDSSSPKKKDPSTKPRQSRKHQSKELNKQDSTMHATTSTSSSSPPRGLPDIPKKTRRKKSKESVNGGGSTRSRTKGTTSSNNNGGTTENSEPAPSIDGDEDQRENRVTLRE